MTLSTTTTDRLERFLDQIIRCQDDSGSAKSSEQTETKETTDLIRVLVINGPNLNLLGLRETEHYGTNTLEEIETICREEAGLLHATVNFFQSNHEGLLVDCIQEARHTADLIVINPAAFTHTSIALRDALLAIQLPVIEVHLSNIHRREPFRHHSYISDIAIGQMIGFGMEGYRMAITYGVHHLARHNRTCGESPTPPTMKIEKHDVHGNSNRNATGEADGP